MIEQITLDMLTNNSVSVKTQRYYNDNNVVYPIGQPHRKVYVNSTNGRSEVISELPQAQQNAIFSVWGDTPTIDENSDI